MTKPRFTADPPPNLDGLPIEEAFRIFVDWDIRQKYRQDDWWPDDHSARIDLLEALFPGAPGTWPIVDYSTVSFNPRVSGLECSPLTATLSSEYDYSAIQVLGEYWGITLSPDGTRLYAADSAGGTLAQGISQFSLSSAFDVTSASFVAHHNEPGGWPLAAAFPYGIHAHPDGNRMFFLDAGYGGPTNPTWKAVVEYSLGTTWDITSLSGSDVVAKRIEGDVAAPIGFGMSRNGLHFFTGENVANAAALHQWTMTTPWDISTASYVGTVDLTTLPGFPAGNYLVRAISIDESGKHIIVNSAGGAGVYVLTLSTPFDISTMSYTRTLVMTGTTDIYGMFIDDECGLLVGSSPLTDEFAVYTLG